MGGAVAQLLWRRHPERGPRPRAGATAAQFKARYNERLSFLGLARPGPAGPADAGQARTLAARTSCTSQRKHRRLGAVGGRGGRPATTGGWSSRPAARSDRSGRRRGSARSTCRRRSSSRCSDEVVPLRRQIQLFESIPGARAFRVDAEPRRRRRPARPRSCRCCVAACSVAARARLIRCAAVSAIAGAVAGRAAARRAAWPSFRRHRALGRPDQPHDARRPQPRAGPPRRRRRLDVRVGQRPQAVRLGRAPRRARRRRRSCARAEQVAERLGNMKGALMKVGQMASYLDDGLPGAGAPGAGRAAGRRPRRCRPTSPPRSSSASSADRPTELFVEWDPEPIAAASIGQVHRAVVVDPATGEERAVAVKVQYPGVGDAIESDLANTELLGTAPQAGLRRPRPGRDGGRDPASGITEELDYEREARQPAALRRLLPRPPVHPRARRAAVAVDRAGCSPASSSSATPWREVLDVGPAPARPRRRGPVPVRVPQPLPDAGVQRRPAPRQLPVPRRRADHVPRLRAGPLLQRRARWRRSPRWSARPPSSTTPAAFRRIVEDAGLLRRDAPVPTTEAGEYFSQFYEPVARRPRR